MDNMIFDKFMGIGDKPDTERGQVERVLPSDVRYALQYREARLRASEISDLAKNGFENEALYLSLKVAVVDPELQLSLMQNLFEDLAHVKSSEKAATQKILQSFVLRELNRLPREFTVHAGKLAQLSRQGFNFWHKIYRECAKKNAMSPAQTYLVGHAPFIGLVPFIQEYARTGKELRIFIPDFIQNPESPICGYRIVTDVEFLSKEFNRTKDAVVIDDTRHTGNSNRKIEAFWSCGGVYPSPQFEFLSVSPNEKN